MVTIIVIILLISIFGRHCDVLSCIFRAVNQICLPDGTRSFLRCLINAWAHVYKLNKGLYTYIAEVGLV